MLYPYALTTFADALSFPDVYFVFFNDYLSVFQIIESAVVLYLTFAFVICSHKRDIRNIIQHG